MDNLACIRGGWQGESIADHFKGSFDSGMGSMALYKCIYF
jgi:hypothetical protein